MIIIIIIFIAVLFFSVLNYYLIYMITVAGEIVLTILFSFANLAVCLQNILSNPYLHFEFLATMIIFPGTIQALH